MIWLLLSLYTHIPPRLLTGKCLTILICLILCQLVSVVNCNESNAANGYNSIFKGLITRAV